MKAYGKKAGRRLKGSRWLDNGCPCCGREHDNKGSTRQYSKKEICELFKNIIEDSSIDISKTVNLKSLGRKVSS